MDLARWFDRICHRASKYHLANPTRLAHLGVVARHRTEQQEHRPHALGIFLATNHIDESGNLSAVVRRIDLAARFPRSPALSRHRFHLPDRTSRIHRHAREELLPRSSLSMLFAAGGVVFERIFARRFRWLKPAIALLVTVSAVVFAPVVLPILSPEKLLAYMRAIHFDVPRTETSHIATLPQLYSDQFGWEEMVGSVARVYASLPPEEQKRAAIFCQNYGEAGAIDSAGNTDYRPRSLDDDAADEREQFRSVEDRGLIESSPSAVPWEQRQHILVCRDLKIPLRELWPKVRVWL
jgi:hypothetical protein